MIIARGDTACRVKGMPPKETKPSRAFSLGRNDNIGATVTEHSVLRYWIF